MPPRDDDESSHFRSQVLREMDQLRGSVNALTTELTNTRLSLAQNSPEAWVQKLKETFVTREEFKPIARLVWGCTFLLLAAMMSGLASLVVKSGGAIK